MLSATDGAIPMADLGRIGFVHIEEMRHGGMRWRFALVIRCHRHDTAKYLEGSAIPVFKDVVVSCEPSVDEFAPAAVYHA